MKLTLTLDLDNAAYRHDDETLDYSQVAATIYALHERIEEGDDSGTLRDDNGNPVGKWEIV